MDINLIDTYSIDDPSLAYIGFTNELVAQNSLVINTLVDSVVIADFFPDFDKLLDNQLALRRFDTAGITIITKE